MLVEGRIQVRNQCGCESEIEGRGRQRMKTSAILIQKSLLIIIIRVQLENSDFLQAEVSLIKVRSNVAFSMYSINSSRPTIPSLSLSNVAMTSSQNETCYWLYEASNAALSS